jgi:hypothetical protein
LRGFVQIIKPQKPEGDYLLMTSGGILKCTADEIRKIYDDIGTLNAENTQNKVFREAKREERK